MFLDSNASNRFFRGFSSLTKVSLICDGVQQLIDWTGSDFRDMSRLITDLALDGCLFLFKYVGIIGGVLRGRRVLPLFLDYLLLYRCRQIQRLSMKGATWTIVNHTERVFEPEPIPQEILIKFVRNHPTLRWLRSDLSEENVAILQQERPEITFVSE